MLLLKKGFIMPGLSPYITRYLSIFRYFAFLDCFPFHDILKTNIIIICYRNSANLKAKGSSIHPDERTINMIYKCIPLMIRQI